MSNETGKVYELKPSDESTEVIKKTAFNYVEIDGQNYQMPFHTKFPKAYPRLFDEDGICTFDRLQEKFEIKLWEERARLIDIIAAGAHYVLILENMRELLADILPVQTMDDGSVFIPSTEKTSSVEKIGGGIRVAKVAGNRFWSLKDPQKNRPGPNGGGDGPPWNEAASMAMTA